VYRGRVAGRIHAIGDAAVDAILDAVERLGAAAGSGTGRTRRDGALAARLAATGLTASMQPAFDATWGGRTACTPNAWVPTERSV